MNNQLRDLDALSLIVQRLLVRTRILTALCVLLGAALALLVLLGAGAPAPRVIEATRFVLRDASGKMRGELTTDEYGPKLKFYDTSGVERVQLFESDSDKGASGLILSTHAAERFGAVQLFAATEGSALILNSVEQQALVTVSADRTSPSMELLDAARFKTVIGVSEAHVPATGEHRTRAV